MATTRNRTTASHHEPDTDFSAASTLEAHAEAVAREILSDEARGDEERGIDFITIITMIISIITTIVQNCPMPKSGMRAAFRRPNVRQKAVLWKNVKSNCDCCNMGRHTLSLNRAMLTRAGGLSDADVDAIINEASSDQNLLV